MPSEEIPPDDSECFIRDAAETAFEDKKLLDHMRKRFFMDTNKYASKRIELAGGVIADKIDRSTEINDAILSKCLERLGRSDYDKSFEKALGNPSHFLRIMITSISEVIASEVEDLKSTI